VIGPTAQALTNQRKDRFMAKADLTAARLRELYLYDAATGVFTRRVSIRQFKAGEVAGFRCGRGGAYVAIKIDQSIYFAHRLAWLYVHGEWPAQFIDHINGNPSDNRIANLRDVSNEVNAQNKRRARGGSGLMGAYPKYRKFRSYIHVDGEQRWIGSFNTAEEANAAFIDAKRRLHQGCTI
jgi:hypothetical protein